jgi:hypothetical protein
MFSGRRAQKFDLAPVTAAPFADNEVAPQTKPFEQGQLAVERGRLEAGGLFAIG